jgi:hypothetical protein
MQEADQKADRNTPCPIPQDSISPRSEFWETVCVQVCLNEQVKRNRNRFPEDFMFWLSMQEGESILVSRSQIATLKRGRNLKYAPYAFTEHGAVMVANVLNSPVAVRARKVWTPTYCWGTKTGTPTMGSRV